MVNFGVVVDFKIQKKPPSTQQKKRARWVAIGNPVGLGSVLSNAFENSERGMKFTPRTNQHQAKIVKIFMFAGFSTVQEKHYTLDYTIKIIGPKKLKVSIQTGT